MFCKDTESCLNAVTVHNVQIDRLVENLMDAGQLTKFANKSIQMLTIIPIYLFWKSYYNLSKTHNRTHWSYGLLGGSIFLFSQFLFAFFIGVIIVAADIKTDLPDFIFSLTAIVFAASAAYGVEYLLKKKWERNPKVDLSESDLLDQ